MRALVLSLVVAAAGCGEHDAPERAPSHSRSSWVGKGEPLTIYTRAWPEDAPSLTVRNVSTDDRSSMLVRIRGADGGIRRQKISRGESLRTEAHVPPPVAVLEIEILEIASDAGLVQWWTRGPGYEPTESD